jgi:hypothetical protein
MSGFRTILGTCLKSYCFSCHIHVKEIAGGSRVDMYFFFKFSRILKSGNQCEKTRETCINSVQAREYCFQNTDLYSVLHYKDGRVGHTGIAMICILKAPLYCFVRRHKLRDRGPCTTAYLGCWADYRAAKAG